MQIISNIAMDLAIPGVTPRIYGKQEDSGGSRAVRINLYNNGIAWDIPSDALPMVRYTGPTGAIGLYDTLPDGSSAFIVAGNTITATLVDQIFAAPGRVDAELRIVDSTGSVSTWSFYIEVQSSKTGDITLPSDYINALANVASQAASAAARAERAAASIDTSAFLPYNDYDSTGIVKSSGGIAKYAEANFAPIAIKTTGFGTLSTTTLVTNGVGTVTSSSIAWTRIGDLVFVNMSLVYTLKSGTLPSVPALSIPLADVGGVIGSDGIVATLLRLVLDGTDATGVLTVEPARYAGVDCLLTVNTPRARIGGADVSVAAGMEVSLRANLIAYSPK